MTNENTDNVLIDLGFQSSIPLEKTARPQHDQADLQPEITIFNHTQFIAYVDGKMVINSATGSMVFTVSVPREYVHLAEVLRYAGGLPLSIDIQKWKDYEQVANDLGMSL